MTVKQSSFSLQIRCGRSWDFQGSDTLWKYQWVTKVVWIMRKSKAWDTWTNYLKKEAADGHPALIPHWQGGRSSWRRMKGLSSLEDEGLCSLCVLWGEPLLRCSQPIPAEGWPGEGTEPRVPPCPSPPLGDEDHEGQEDTCHGSSSLAAGLEDTAEAK